MNSDKCINLCNLNLSKDTSINIWKFPHAASQWISVLVTATQIFSYHISSACSKTSYKWDHISLSVVICFHFFLDEWLGVGLLGHGGRIFSLISNCQIFSPSGCTMCIPTNNDSSNSSIPSPTFPPTPPF